MATQAQSYFSDAEAATLRNFKNAIDSFGAKHKTIERPAILCLMWIAENPGIDRHALMKNAKMTEASVTRNCHLLIGRDWIRDMPSEERSNALAYELTITGAAFLRKMAGTLQRPTTGTHPAH